MSHLQIFELFPTEKSITTIKFESLTTHFIVLTVSQTSPGFYVSAVQVENTVGKGEITRDEQLLLYPQCFLQF